MYFRLQLICRKLPTSDGLLTYLWLIFQMSKLDSADNILVDDDIQFCRNYLSRTSSIAGNGKEAGNAVLLP